MFYQRSFMMLSDDDELPEDEEEILVYVEFDGSFPSNAFSNEKLRLDIIGLDMEHPIMQINGKFYEGTYEDAMGTCLFFERDKNPNVHDPVFDTTPTLKYFAKTRKVLKMSRIFVEMKTELLGDSNDPECVPSMKIIEKSGIPPQYQKGALESWEKMRQERLKALNDYLEKQRIRNEKRSQGIEPESSSDDDNPFAVYKPETKMKKFKTSKNPTGIHFPGNGNSAKKSKVHDQNSKDSDSNVPNTEDPIPLISNDTVIDPGPSTSKDSKPWRSPTSEKLDEHFSTSDSNDDTYDINLSNVKGMHKATVQATRRAKVRKHGKLVNKKLKKTTVEPMEIGKKLNSIDKTGSSKSAGEKPLRDESNKTGNYEKTVEEPTRILKDIESLTLSQTTKKLRMYRKSDALKNPKVCPSTDEVMLEKQERRKEKMREITERWKKAAEEQRLKKQHCSQDAV